MGADLLDGDVELTEFEAIDVESIKGVGKGANGFPHLLMKGLAAAADPEPEPEPVSPPVPDWHPQAVALVKAWLETPGAAPSDLLKAIAADGSVDETPDIDGGMQAIALIGKLIGYEADELAAGHLDETCDIDLLNSAANCVKAWLSRERAGAMVATDAANMGGCGCCGMCTGPGCGCCPDCPGPLMQSAAEDDVAKDSRTFSAAERKKHAAAGNALPDGSYPIPDADALRRAAILARSGHGDVKAARKLIGKRAKELGVANPLDEDDTDASASKGTLAEGEATVQDETQDGGLIAKAVEAAVTEALGPHKAEIESLRGELAKVLALPRPGGPRMSLVPGDSYGAAVKAPGPLDNPGYLRQMADTVTDRETRELYRQAARQAEEKATLTP